MQGLVYGKHLGKAQPFPGFREFLSDSLKLGYEVRIISHKTQFNAVGDKVDLRSCAEDWLNASGIVGDNALSRSHVFFLSTRTEKVEKIRNEGCAVFIDDLPEVFLEPGFSQNIRRILFQSEPDERLPGIEHTDSWKEIHRRVLGS